MKLRFAEIILLISLLVFAILATGSWILQKQGAPKSTIECTRTGGDCVTWLWEVSPERYCDWAATVAQQGAQWFTQDRSRADLDSLLTGSNQLGRSYTNHERQVIIAWLRRGWDQAHDGLHLDQVFEANIGLCWTGESSV